ncbi:MAG TPA: hypothetical protein VK900_04725 [Anaerolineales bacterium]|nr:hypothetical protein [Anaerolineales bacterium]
MLTTKFISSIFLILAVLFVQVSNVAAAPTVQDTPPAEITQVETETGEDGVTTVLVTLLLEDETTQTVRISLDYAAQLGLIDPDTQLPFPLEQLPADVTIDPAQLIPEEETEGFEVHLISSLLADFFFDGDPAMASLIDSFHTGENESDQVFGFGVIAQALWMSQGFNNGSADAEVAEQILLAKQSGDYSAFELPDGTSPTNWGQFKKALRENKEKHNLGSIVSGQADTAEESVGEQVTEDTDQSTGQQDHGNGKEKNKDKGKGKDKNKNRP